MRKKNLYAAAAVLAVAGVLAGCAASEDGEQRYAYPLGTASPEDTDMSTGNSCSKRASLMCLIPTD